MLVLDAVLSLHNPNWAMGGGDAWEAGFVMTRLKHLKHADTHLTPELLTPLRDAAGDRAGDLAFGWRGAPPAVAEPDTPPAPPPSLVSSAVLDPLSASRIPAPNATATPAQRQAAILVIENEDSNRFLMEQILRLAGYQCLSASNGIEGLAMLDRERVDLVLTDLSMPLLDGYQTTELMRQRPHAATLPIIAVTAHAMSDQGDLARNAGCTDVLIKPYRPRDLVRLIERWLHEAPGTMT
ncbi:MAG: response regulator [Ktedonobacterales bacterium]